MPEVIFSVDRDLSVPISEQAMPSHNRWHPDIPPGEQAYLLLGAAPVEGRIGGIVDIPNCAVTLGIPPAIFDRDILPT